MPPGNKRIRRIRTAMTDDDTGKLTMTTTPPSVQRILDTRDQILGDPDPEELRYLHSILAQ